MEMPTKSSFARPHSPGVLVPSGTDVGPKYLVPNWHPVEQECAFYYEVARVRKSCLHGMISG
jgi:hypothetical protein